MRDRSKENIGKVKTWSKTVIVKTGRNTIGNNVY